MWHEPDNFDDCEGWVQTLLCDTAGQPAKAALLLEAIWDVQSGRIGHWTNSYQAYDVAVGPFGVDIIVPQVAQSCRVPLDLLAATIGTRLGM